MAAGDHLGDHVGNVFDAAHVEKLVLDGVEQFIPGILNMQGVGGSLFNIGGD